MNNLIGIHHVSALTSSAEKIYHFFTNILGMRLVKKTVNQDDISTYHLFFADEAGSPGTDMTFFDFRNVARGVKGVNEISRTSFRVKDDAAIDYWVKRFQKYNVVHEDVKIIFGRKVLYFEDFDKASYALFSDQNDNGVKAGIAWDKGPIPNEFAITALGPIYFRINDLDRIAKVLKQVLQMREVEADGNFVLYEMGEGGNGASIILEVDETLPRGLQGAGSIHHVAFRVKDEEALREWLEHIDGFGVPNSGFVDRHYFKSLYSRMYPGILFEFATDGPGFIDEYEGYETLGESLALPPKFIDKRAYIESKVRHIDTVRSTKVFEKEYL